VLSVSEELLEISAAEFTNGVHEINNRTVIPFNEDTRRAVMWKVSRGHENSVGSAHCFSIGSIRTGEERDCKGVKEGKTLSGVFPKNNAGATYPMLTEGLAIKMNDEVKVFNWGVTYIQGCPRINFNERLKITMNATASAQFKLYITVRRA